MKNLYEFQPEVPLLSQWLYKLSTHPRESEPALFFSLIFHAGLTHLIHGHEVGIRCQHVH